MSIAESIWQSLLSQGTAIAVLVTVAYLFRDAILRFINDKISLASKKELQSREHEFKTQFDEVRRDFERIQSTQEKFLTAFLEVSSERAKAVSKREIEAAEAIWASVETLNRLLLSAKTADMLEFDAIEKLGSSDRLVRQGIRAVAEGNAPKGVQCEGTGERPTFCNNTVARIPAPADPEADRRLRIAFGREVTKRILAGEYSKEEPGCADPRGLDEIRHALA